MPANSTAKTSSVIKVVILLTFLSPGVGTPDVSHKNTVSGRKPATWIVKNLQDGKVGLGSEESPFRNLQIAIDKAGDGDFILIQPGTYEAQPADYVENLCGNCQKHRTPVRATRGFLVKNKALHLVGTDREKTILVTKAGYGLLFDSSCGSVVSGLQITGGIRDADGAATDAGIVARFSTVTVTDCLVRDNVHRIDTVVVGIGGIMGRENSELFIVNNTIKNNGWDGVALYRGASAFIADNLIDQGRGAGIGITWDASAIVVRNRVSGYWKGIGTFGESRAIVRNNAVFDNLGWGVVVTGSSYMDATNNVITRNGNCGLALWDSTATGRATNNIITENGWRKEWVCPCVGIWIAGDPAKFRMTYNNVWNNSAGNWHDYPDQNGQNGNISVDPQFLGKIDFHVSTGSPTIDTGNPLFTDPDGSRSDLGLYGGSAAR